MEKAIFHGDIANMMNKDSNWHGSGSRAFSTGEMENFIEHLWEYFNKHTFNLDWLALTKALIATQHIDSAQDRATEIIQTLEHKK